MINHCNGWEVEFNTPTSYKKHKRFSGSTDESTKSDTIRLLFDHKKRGNRTQIFRKSTFPTWTQTNKKFLFFQHSTTELKAQERLTNNRRVQLKNRFEQWKFSQLFPNVRWWLWLCCEAHVFMLHISVMCSEGWAHLCTTTLYGTAFHEKFNYKHTTQVKAKQRSVFFREKRENLLLRKICWRTYFAGKFFLCANQCRSNKVWKFIHVEGRCLTWTRIFSRKGEFSWKLS